jgi:4-hydroxymandelate oxidase
MDDKIKSPWPGPEGLIPVTNGKAEDANKINRQYLDDLLVEMRVMMMYTGITATKSFDSSVIHYKTIWTPLQSVVPATA